MKYKLKWLILPTFSIFFLIVFQNRSFSQDLQNIKNEKTFRLSGNIGLFGDAYYAQGIEPRSVPLNYRITGNPIVQLFGMTFPFYFNIGNQNRSFAQPFNQFGASPRYKWLTVHLGWRSLSYSQYTLSGLMFLGAGVDINPRKFRFSAMYGRFTRAVREDLAQQFVSPVPAFTRLGFATKIGVGSNNNFIDLIFFKAKDDSSSNPQAPLTLKPAENFVIGLNSRLLLAKHFQVTFDGGISAFTRNTSLSPLEDENAQRIRPIILINASSQLLSAFNGSMGYVSKFFNLRIRYRRVDQDYKSMGAYLFETDAEAYTIEPSLNLFKGKLRLNGSIGKQRDNLLRTKIVTTNRTIGSCGLSWNPIRNYGLDLQYGNYGIAQREGVVPLNDTTRLALANQNFNLINRLSFINKYRAMTFVLVNVYQKMQNLNPYSTSFAQSEVFISNLNFTYTFIKNRASINAGLNYSKNNFAQGEVIMVGPIIGAGKSFFKNKINTTFTAGLIRNSFILNNNVGLTKNANLNLSYAIHRKHNLIANLRAVRNTASNPLSVPFTEIFLSAGYQLQFQ